MFETLYWWAYLLLAGLPAAAFVLGVVRTRRQFLAGRDPFGSHSLEPEPQPRDVRSTAEFDAIQRQLEELAERQDFTERLIAKRPSPAPSQSKLPRNLVCRRLCNDETA